MNLWTSTETRAAMEADGMDMASMWVEYFDEVGSGEPSSSARASGLSRTRADLGSPRLSAQSPNPSRRRSSQRWVANSPPK